MVDKERLIVGLLVLAIVFSCLALYMTFTVNSQFRQAGSHSGFSQPNVNFIIVDNSGDASEGGSING